MKHPIRKLLAIAIVAGASLIGLNAASPASAATPCVSKAEFKTLAKGMTVTQVQNRTGAKGTVSYSYDSGSYKFQARDYRACGSEYGFVSVSFSSSAARNGNRLGLSSKSGMWF